MVRSALNSIYTVAFLLIVPLCTSSCSQFLDNGEGPLDFLPDIAIYNDTRPPVVMGSFPPNGALGVDANSTIFVSFSQDMNREATENSFSLSTNAGPVDGVFRWVGNTMEFVPSGVLDRAGFYNYRVDSNRAENSNGVNLLDDYSASFSFGTDTNRPSVVSIQPSPGASGVATTADIVIEFSEAVNPASVYAAISTVPEMNLQYTAAVIDNGGSRFTLTPAQVLQNGVNYSVSLDTSVEDLDGNTLVQSYSTSFTVGNDFDNPTLLSVSTPSVANFAATEYITINGLEKDEVITLVFDEPILMASLLDGISFDPNVEFDLVDVLADGTTFEIQPRSNLPLGETMEFRLTRDIQDLGGNSLDRARTYYPKINGPSSQFLQIRAIYRDLTGSVFSQPLDPATLNQLPSGTTPHCEDYNTDNSFPSECDMGPLYFYVCWGATVGTCQVPAPFPAGGISIVPSSIDLSVQYVSGAASSPSIDLEPFTDATPAAFTDYFVFSTIFYSVPSTNTYRIVVQGGPNGLRDTAGNYMEEDYEVLFVINP